MAKILKKKLPDGSRFSSLSASLSLVVEVALGPAAGDPLEALAGVVARRVLH
jgi:hypothetical protein